jgi:hypothetical protein
LLSVHVIVISFVTMTSQYVATAVTVLKISSAFKNSIKENLLWIHLSYVEEIRNCVPAYALIPATNNVYKNSIKENLLWIHLSYVEEVKNCVVADAIRQAVKTA